MPKAKKERKQLEPNFGSEGLPALPDILNPSIALQVFTHRSYFARPTHVFEDRAEDPAPDNEILEHQGDAVLTLVVTDLLRQLYPHLRVGPSTKIRSLMVGNPTLAIISKEYKLPLRLRLHSAQEITLKLSANVQADLFESYIGGLYIDRGLDIVRDWLNRLFRPYAIEAYEIVRNNYKSSPLPPEGTNSLGGTLVSQLNGLTLPTEPVPPLSPESRPTIGHLSLFNQLVHDQVVEWAYNKPDTEETKVTPIWIARVVVNGECWGSGKGRTKKAARDEAAKVGLATMGVEIP